LKLREVTRKVIASLEEKSGYIAKVTEDSALPTLATIRKARGYIPAHNLLSKLGVKNESPETKHYSDPSQATLRMQPNFWLC
jgi:hypothetical protein